MTRTRGVSEWADRSLNISYGCSNNCSYCYAKRMWDRFRKGRGKPPQPTWTDWELNRSAIDKGYREVNHKSKWDYMFPTSHDIFLEIIDECIIVLKKVLRAGNTVLITTKADFDCISVLSEELRKWQNQLNFRITIGTDKEGVRERYEPNAPSLTSRCLSLIYLGCHQGYTTSMSMEPFLSDPIPLLKEIGEAVTDTIWIGIMSGSVPEELRPLYTRESLTSLAVNLRELPKEIQEKIRFKDSIVNKINLPTNKMKTSITSRGDR